MDKDFMYQSLFEGSRGLDFEVEDIKSIPLPNQLPAKIDSQNWPEEVLKSSAVDSLINQNEDLLSRLAVQIRRNSLLEEQVFEAQKIKSEAEKEKSNLLDQVMVLKQKDALTKNRYHQLETTIREQKDKLNFLETKYTEYYSTTQSNMDTLKGQIKNKSLLVSNFSKYRTKIRPLYKNYVELSKKLQNDLNASESARTTAQKQLGEAAEHIQSLNKAHLDELKNLRQTLNGEIEKLKEEKKTLIHEKTELEIKLKNHQAIFEENISLKNETLRLKRAIDTDKARYNLELEETQKLLAQFRQDSKTKTIELNELQIAQKSELEQSMIKDKALHQLQNQVESLQLLWKESQAKAEKLDNQNKSLQKLNRQLSEKLQDYRHKIKKVQEQTECQSLLVGQSLQAAAQLEGPKNPEANDEPSEMVLGKINQLLHEIQAGFSQNKEEPSLNSAEE